MKILLRLAAVCCLLPVFAFAAELKDLIPPDGTPQGWAKADSHIMFKGDALFRHINGGAELYHEHGFVALLVQDFKNDDLEVRLELYDMGSASGAGEVFKANTKGLQTNAEYGVASSLDQYQIIFHQGRYYISLTCYTGSEAEQAAMAALAKALSAQIG